MYCIAWVKMYEQIMKLIDGVLGHQHIHKHA